MKCYIVRDLLPRYLDGLTGEEASGEIEAHLNTCGSCHIIYEQMAADIPQGMSPAKKNIDFLKKLKTKMRRQNGMIALAVCLALIAVIAFLKHFNIPIPYNQEYLAVEIMHTAAIPNPPYQTQWRDLDLLDFETTKAFLAGEYNDCAKRDFVEIHYGSFYNVRIQKSGRTLNRNDETVNVVYFCETRELWDVLFSRKHETDLRATGGGWFIVDVDDNMVHAYTPRMTEIYYLPMRSPSRLERLSDEAFDAERERGVLVWSGVI